MWRRSGIIIVLLYAASPAPAMQGMAMNQHEHATASSSVPVQVPVPMRRWTPDGPLRAGMRRAHQAVAELHHAQVGHMSAAMTRERAARIESAVAFMFAHCKLSAQPDAALHGILVPLLTAAQALKANPAATHVVDDMRAALAQYPRYFSDPGWDTPASAGADPHGSP